VGNPDTPRLALDSSYARELVGLYEPWRAVPSPRPELLVFNDALSDELGLDTAALRTPAGVALLVGNAVSEGAVPIAQAYAGHQFGGYSPRLGDGRALLLGEIVGRDGTRRDLHLKGSGRTPFARGGDGRAAVGPMLREYVIGEAMHALGIPTTRALAVVSTGETIARETMLPGAILCRVAASHLRVGTFQYAASLGEPQVRQLVDYAIARHVPAAAHDANPTLAFLESVIDAQSALVARWMLVGFVHGVMNTDNMTISGETIDYGPCAFLDAYDPATVFSSIDRGGRYAFGNQPAIAQWNLARLAETLLPLIDPSLDRAVDLATSLLQSFPARYLVTYDAGMRAKLGLPADAPDALVSELLSLMHAEHADYTSTFRALANVLRGAAPLRFADQDRFTRWTATWRRAVTATPDALDRVNPVYVPRNHKVEEALAAATAGDLAPVHRLLAVVAAPFAERPDLDDYASPAPASAVPYRTFCGT
jgi:uncharacterized protein YdiU (UPF0061 family)